MGRPGPRWVLLPIDCIPGLAIALNGVRDFRLSFPCPRIKTRPVPSSDIYGVYQFSPPAAKRICANELAPVALCRCRLGQPLDGLLTGSQRREWRNWLNRSDDHRDGFFERQGWNRRKNGTFGHEAHVCMKAKISSFMIFWLARPGYHYNCVIF